jgi:hypothetical protein
MNRASLTGYPAPIEKLDGLEGWMSLKMYARIGSGTENDIR